MRFNSYINENAYISLLEKDKYKKPENKRVQRILDELNRYTSCHCDDYKFTVADELVSPTDAPVKMDEKKKEILTRLWMQKCEELEEIKQKDLDKDE